MINENKCYVLKANKTKMYKLVKDVFSNLEISKIKIEEFEFFKLTNPCEYFLYAYKYEFRLYAFCGSAHLSCLVCGEEEVLKVIPIPLDELVKREMVREFKSYF